MLSNTRTLCRMPYKNQNVDKKSLRSQRLQYSAWNPLRSKKNLRTCIGPVIGPLLALLQCHTWRLWSSATKTRCLKQSATAPACVSCTCQLVGFLHASKNGSWTIDWAFSMGRFFHGPPPLGHILRTFNPSRSNRNSFLWGHQRLLEVAGSKQALENITPSWLPFPPVKVPILQGRLEPLLCSKCPTQVAEPLCREVFDLLLRDGYDLNCALVHPRIYQMMNSLEYLL